MKVKITKKIINYIKNNKEHFDFVVPLEGQLWDVVETKTCENVGDESVAELQNADKSLRIPFSLIFSNITKIIIK